jgi:hypothetical protein
MTQLLLSHGGIRIRTLPGARVQGELVSTCMVDPAYMIFRRAQVSVFLPERELPTPSLMVPVARSFSAMGCTWMLSLAHARPYCSPDSLRRGLEPKCDRVLFEVSYQLIQELESTASAQPRASGK